LFQTEPCLRLRVLQRAFLGRCVGPALNPGEKCRFMDLAQFVRRLLFLLLDFGFLQDHHIFDLNLGLHLPQITASHLS
jgi:hypothetical protein